METLSVSGETSLHILVIGFGTFGQFISNAFRKNSHTVTACNLTDESAAASLIECEYISLEDLCMLEAFSCDVVVLAVSILSFELVLAKIPKQVLTDKLIVDVLSVKVHARDTMMASLPSSCDILCTHPMFGPESGKNGWSGLKFMYEKVRVAQSNRCDAYLQIWSHEECDMIEMTCSAHDSCAAKSQFLTHFLGRSLHEMKIENTCIDTKSFETYILGLVQAMMRNSDDLFVGLFAYNNEAETEVLALKAAIDVVHKRLVQAKDGMKSNKTETEGV